LYLKKECHCNLGDAFLPITILFKEVRKSIFKRLKPQIKVKKNEI